MHDFDDLALVELAQSGKLDAVGELYDRHRPRIFRYIRFRVGHLQTAQDLTSEVFLRMVKHLDQFRPRDVPFSAWLYKIARNLMIKEGVRTNRQPHLALDHARQLNSHGDNPAAVVERQLTLERVADKLERLDEMQREVILLRFIAGLSLKETAAALDKSVAAVKTWQHRGIQALHLAAALRELPTQDGSTAEIAQQREALLTAAAVHLQPRESGSSPAALSARLQLWLDRLLLRQELALGAAAVLLVLMFALAWWGSRAWPADVVEVAEQLPPPADSQPAAPEIDSGSPLPSPVESPEIIEVSPADSSHMTYLPVTSADLALDPQTAGVKLVAGWAEIQDADGAWTPINRMAVLTTGQRLRTGPLSEVVITFFDGSRAIVSADSELSVDALDAQRSEDGFRTVIMTQHLGDSDHEVQFRNDSGSRYEVHTPAGSGIARGTKFHVAVTPTLEARFVVSEGRVEAIDPWRVAGTSFEVRPWTIIEPDVEVGDQVRVSGMILPDGTWVAGRIERVESRGEPSIIVIGPVSGVEPWVIGGLRIIIDGETVILGEISTLELVFVRVRLLPNGRWKIKQIHKAHPKFGLGCLTVNTPVVSVQPTSLTVAHGPQIDLDDSLEILGEIKRESVILLPICIAFDGTIIVNGQIIVIHQPIVVIVPPAPGSRGNDNGNDNHNG